MDGIHDLGGKQGFGRIAPQSDEKALPERWQGAVFTIVNTLIGNGTARNVDHFRHAVERIDPRSYLQDGYYGRWLGAAETLLVEAGCLSQQEITERALARGAHPDDRIAARPASPADDFSGVSGDEDRSTARRAVTQAAQFEPGQRVRTQLHGKSGHTRLPAYARGVEGEIVSCHGAWVYPDTNAHGLGEQPRHLYTVAFSAAELFGEAGEQACEVCIDLFEPYLQRVE